VYTTSAIWAQENDGTLSSSALLTKYSSNGDSLWSTLFDRGSHEQVLPGQIETDPQGNVVFTLSYLSYDEYRRDLAIAKYDSDGNEVWFTFYEDSLYAYPHANDLLIDNAGGIVLTGSLWSELSTIGNAMVMKFDGEGELLWQSTVAHESGHLITGHQIEIDSNDNIYALCSSQTQTWFGYENERERLLKYSPEGELQIDELAGVPGKRVSACKLIVSDNDEIIIAGTANYDFTDLMGGGFYKAFVAKYTQTLSNYVDDMRSLPQHPTLNHNFPNPFNPTTNISYTLPVDSDVSLIVYDVLGREVRNLATGIHAAGSYIVSWDGMTDGGHSVSAGIYFARLSNSDCSQTIKMLLVK